MRGTLVYDGNLSPKGLGRGTYLHLCIMDEGTPINFKNSPIQD